MPFAALGLHPCVTKTIEDTGYTTPTSVQTEAIPAALEGKDLLVSSHTGSGKTAAFLLPSLHRMNEPSPVPGNGPRLLVLCPTRELALQVQKQAVTYGKGLRRLKTVCLVGGAPFGPQFQALKANPEVMIATPGRLMDHMERGRIDFSRLETLVLDEADRMLDMGFIEDIEHIVSATPATRQTLLFSATLDGVVGKLAQSMTRDAQRIEIAGSAENKADIDQRILMADDLAHKHRLLEVLLRDTELTQAVVFTSTKRAAEELSETLLEQGFAAAALHGDMPQHKRNRTLQRLRDGATRVLVATDVAARGIDVVGISHVINFDAPHQAEDYVHRIGRTGRAGRSGIAVSLLNWRERHLLRDIERFTGNKPRVDVIPGLEPKERSRFDADKAKPRSGYGQKRDFKPGQSQGRDWNRDRPAKPGGFGGGFKPREAAQDVGHSAPADPVHKHDDSQPGADAWKSKPTWKDNAGKKAWGHAPRKDVGVRSSAGSGAPRSSAPRSAAPQGAGKPRGEKPGGGGGRSGGGNGWGW
ncbi:MAG: DEAD/DEAH box helicase [Betaproteobacteria bacterium]|nr:DEAD/DEAH box helicase [Betaproteobacteria bacterium]